MSVQNLFSLSYWFEVMPGPLNTGSKIFFLSTLLILILGAIITAWRKKKGGMYIKTWSRLYDFCAGNFMLSLVFFFFRYEAVPFLSGRFWLATWFISMAIWLYVIIKSMKSVEEVKAEAKRQAEINKYIP